MQLPIRFRPVIDCYGFEWILAATGRVRLRDGPGSAALAAWSATHGLAMIILDEQVGDSPGLVQPSSATADNSGG